MRLQVLQDHARHLPPPKDLDAFVGLMTLFTPEEMALHLAEGLLRHAQLANACGVSLGQAVVKLLADTVYDVSRHADATAGRQDG
jgi:hypothetical protein